MIKLNPENKYLIGVSGGPDSMFLLSQLLKNNPAKIVVCHVNYHSQPNADLDQALVEKFCQNNNLAFELYSIDPEIYQNLAENFESWARKVRYNFFQTVGEKHQIFNLLIAHNQNDLVETYLLQKKRKNLVIHYGLKTISSYQNLMIIRPILKVKRSTIIDFLNKASIEYHLDPTNENLDYERNKIRSTLREESFPKYLDLIEQDNKNLTAQLNWAEFYLKNNCLEQELTLTPQLARQNHELIQRVVYGYFKSQSQEQLLHNRKNKTLAEISGRLQKSRKTFWQLDFGSKVLIKDFEQLYLLDKKNLKKKTFEIHNQEELKLLNHFANAVDLFKAIKLDGENYPYIVSNDFEQYKSHTTYRGQKMNRYLINRKVRYKNRFFNGIIYQTNKMKVLNEIGTVRFF